MSTLDRCLESLAFCHLQDEVRRAAARIVAQQDIDEWMREAGPELSDQHRALTLLMEGFQSRFPDESDPVLIRSYMRRQMRRIGFDLRRDEQAAGEAEALSELDDTPATAPDASDMNAVFDETLATEPR